MLLRILHHTHYAYQTPVLQARHLAFLRPLETHGQVVLAHRIDITPAPALQHQSMDAFGNWQYFFDLQGPHERLDVVADSLVRTTGPGALPASPSWESVRESFRYRKQAPYLSASEFVFASPAAPREQAFCDFARPSFLPERPLLDACRDLCRRIHSDLRYETASTEVHTPALEALKQGKGVCQDFAHIMIACLRSLGLAARYVSGYLLTQPPPGQKRLIGADASHAWVSVYSDGHWFDFDPTNNRSGCHAPGEDYVTLAIGRDYADVSPLRGVIQGGGLHTLQVAVTVAPPEDFEPVT